MADLDLRTMMAERPLRFGERSATGCDYFDYQPDQPNLYLLMRFKQLLVEAHGIEAGFELYRRTITRQKSSTLHPRRLASQHAYCAVGATHFEEIVPAGEPFTIPPPRVIGEGNHRPLSNVTRSFYLACLEDAEVRGRSSIIEAAGLALVDFQGDELARIDDEVEFDSAVFHRAGDDLWMISQDQPAIELECAFSLLGCRTDFFGDWLVSSILTYVAATLGGQLPPGPILIDANMPITHRQSLELVLAPGATIVEIPAFQAARVRRLWLAPGITYMPFHQKLNQKFLWDYVMSSPERFAPIADEMCRRADLILGPTRGPARVFLARKAFRHRKLVNRGEIEAIAAKCGFVIIYPEDRDFAEQARLVRDAQFVVAPEGSALFLYPFLSRGAKLCILNHPETLAVVGYNGGCERKGVELTIITGPGMEDHRGRSQDMDYSIDAGVFRRFLDTWFEIPAS